MSHAALTNIFSLNNVTDNENLFYNCRSGVTESSTPKPTTSDISPHLMEVAALENRVRAKVSHMFLHLSDEQLSTLKK